MSEADAARPGTDGRREYDWDSLVVGSGFGGGVAALRLAQSGRRVMVAEMGRRVSPADMRRAAGSPRHLLWMPEVGLRTGFFRQTVMRHMIALAGVGVGGGSLVYAAVLLRPRDTFWGHSAWRSAGLGARARGAVRDSGAHARHGAQPVPWAAGRVDAAGSRQPRRG